MMKIDEKNKNLSFDFEVNDNINKILYGDSDKIKQIVLYFSRYLASKIEKENIKIKINKVVAGNLCKLKFTFIIFIPEVDELIKINQRIKSRWLKKVDDDIDYDIINSLLKKVDGTISIKKDKEHTEITISIIQRIMKEYNTNNEEIDDMMPKEYDDMTEEDRIKSCSTKLFQRFNDINVPVVIMVTKNKKRLEKSI